MGPSFSAITGHTYDPLNRLASQTTGTATTSYSYLGLTSELASENDPGTQAKSYAYTPDGLRLFQATTGGSNPGTGYYSYNNHGDVEAVTGSTGTTTATYGYTAYGANNTSMFTGADKNNTQPGSSTTPYNSYRYNAMRWDPGSGQYDMGFRNYDPGLNSFLSRDMYNGALNDVALTTDPFTGGRYAFGDGNPISNIELDGHMFPAGGGAAGCPYGTIGCLGYRAPQQSNSGGGCSWLSCVGQWFSAGANWLGTQGTSLLGGALNGITDFASWVGTPFRWLGAKLVNSMPTGATASGQLTFTNHASDAVRQSPWNIGNRNSIAYKIGYYGWPLLVPPVGEEDPIAARLQSLTDRAVAQFESGQIGLSAPQARAAALDPSLFSMFRGQVIDTAVKNMAWRDPNLANLYITRSGEFGPDFLDLNSLPGTPHWYDVTTPEDWLTHVQRYASLGQGTGIFYR